MFQNKEGQRVPAVTFRTRDGADWKDVTSDDLFAGKTVIVFSLPGAFTPTCSSTHVPRYNQLASKFRQLGVDDIICMSVNDAFVMNEWKKSQEAENITFIPDGNTDFTAGMGLLVGKEDLGFGQRSWRYSMLVRDGMIEKMFIEPQEPGDPFKVSDADTMLEYIDPQGARPLDVTMFSRSGCPHCVRARSALRDAGIEFDTLELNSEFSERTLRAVSGRTTVPQVFVNGALIGGADELESWLSADQHKAA